MGQVHNPRGIFLTDEETAWIKAHPQVRVNGGEWEPFTINNADGTKKGVSVEILEKVANLAGIRVEYVYGAWPQLMEMLKNGKLDLAQCIKKTKKRDEVMRHASEIGLEGFLIKPVSQSVLFNTIMDVFGEKMKIEPKTALGTSMVEEARNVVAGARVLLAEDNITNQQVTTELLQQAGLHVTIANSGLKAVELAH